MEFAIYTSYAIYLRCDISSMRYVALRQRVKEFISYRNKAKWSYIEFAKQVYRTSESEYIVNLIKISLWFCFPEIKIPFTKVGGIFTSYRLPLHSYLWLSEVCGCYNTISSVPAPIRAQPIPDFRVIFSFKKTKAKIRVITTLNLSIGTTFDASPTWSAL